jgi:hypothetical protein
MRRVCGVVVLIALVTLPFQPVSGQFPWADMPPEKKYEDFAKVTRGAREYEGLFRLHHKDDHVYAEIRPEQFDRPFLAPISIAKGLARGGETLNFDEQWVLAFKRVGDRVFLLRKNVRYRASSDQPVATAVQSNFTDSVLLSLPIRSIHPTRQSVLIDLNDIFLSDFGQLNLGSFDASRSTWHKVKAYPRNIELQVAATYTGRGGNDAVIDRRGTTVIVHYGLVELPNDSGFTPRLADDRVGHFVSVVRDYTSDNRDTSFVRYVNRWRLEKADPKAKLSPPKRRIVYWIEKSVPHEYRPYVREGILEWNKAFEKIGFKDAIEVRQQENEEFDPEDMNYNTFRWTTTDRGIAYGPSRVNPMTGEILDADILFDADMVRFWKQENLILAGPNGLLDPDGPLSTTRATRLGLGLGGWNDRDGNGPAAIPDLKTRMEAARRGLCQCGPCMRQELGFLGLALIARNQINPGERVPEEVIGQAIKMVTMHEVGHTLGLRHNFKASTMLKNDQLHDVSITRQKGLVASVMDYAPVNIAPKGVRQGDYFTTTIGPYDYWAIEYAYKPLSGGTEGEREELAKIAARGAAEGLEFGTDEDLYGTSDPLTNTWDLGADPMRFAMDRMKLADELLTGLAERIVDKGEGYQRARLAFSLLLRQYGNAADLISQQVGGVLTHRDHRGDPNARDPFVPVKPARQREALQYLQEHVLTDRPFNFSPELLRRLAADRWFHWGNETAGWASVDFPLYARILGIQKIALSHLLDPRTLARIQNNAAKVDKGEAPFSLTELFRSLSNTVWTDLPALDKKDRPAVASSVIRRNLQREHLKMLGELAIGNNPVAPADARSLARLHLRELNRRLEAALAAPGELDDLVRAFYEESRDQVNRLLNAAIQTGAY